MSAGKMFRERSERKKFLDSRNRDFSKQNPDCGGGGKSNHMPSPKEVSQSQFWWSRKSALVALDSHGGRAPCVLVLEGVEVEQNPGERGICFRERTE